MSGKPTTTVSIISTEVAPVKVSCWDGFLSCFKGARKTVEFAIKLGGDAAIITLQSQITANKNLTPAQKAALSNMTAASFEALKTSAMAQLTEHLAPVVADPRLQNAIDIGVAAASSTGMAAAFVPSLASAAGTALSSAAVGTVVPAAADMEPALAPAIAMLPTIVTTTNQVRKALQEAAKATGPVVLDLSSSASAVTVRDAAIKAMVEKAVRDSGHAHPNSLLRTGAPLALVTSMILDSNAAIVEAQKIASTATATALPAAAAAAVDMLDTGSNVLTALDPSAVLVTGDAYHQVDNA